MMKTSVWILLAFVVCHCKKTGVRSQSSRVEDACTSCYPEIGDLLIGRESRFTTNSTCGLDRSEKYCIVSPLEEIKKCLTCDSRQEYDRQYRTTWQSHRLQSIVSTFRRDWKQKWWQAQNGIENVYLQLDLEAEFRFTHLIMRFKTFRPRAMYIERSYDFGNMWHIYRYYAYDCQREFPGVPTGMITNISDVICESQYSDLLPSTEGEVVFRALPPSINIEDPYSPEVQHLIKITNLRIVFKKLHTLGDDQLGSRIDVNQKYYYSIYDMVVRGSCNCYGHASRCKPMEGQQPRRNMVYGVCECHHNTKGVNCEQCEDLYNDLPWRPALGTENVCKECNCNSHSKWCHFDAAVYVATGQASGGVCDDCQHSTHGRNCEQCLPGFYRDPSLPLTDPNVCKYIAGNLWVWIIAGVLALITTLLILMFICYYYKKYKQNDLSEEGQQEQLIEMTYTHMRSSRVSNAAGYEEIQQDIPAQLEAPRPPVRHPDQTIDTGIYLTQAAEAGSDTSLLKTLHTEVSDMMNDENMTDGYLKPTNHLEQVATALHREEEPKNEFNDEYETYDHQDHPAQIPQKTTDRKSPDYENAAEAAADYQAMKPHPPPQELVEYQILKK